MKQIRLTQGKFAKIDDDDLGMVSAYSWHAHKGKHTYYARGFRVIDGKIQKVYMHRLLLGLKPGQKGDHRNGEGLDNQRHNLRVCNDSQNQANRRPAAGGSSKYKGVKLYRDGKTWVAGITKCYKGIHLGYFKEEIEAAKAYDSAALELFGEFARTNFPQAKVQSLK